VVATLAACTRSCSVPRATARSPRTSVRWCA
jgi:hypothetical protein